MGTADNMIIGRHEERQRLNECLQSPRSELVVVYGRRRIGKTFLIERHFNGQFDFWYTGARGLNTQQQLRLFAKTLKSYSGVRSYKFSDWLDAFDALEDYLETLPKDKKKLIFIDEMPWMDTGRSNFVIALENFWNGWAMYKHHVMLIATGSSTSWMTDKLITNRGGLYARITYQLHLDAFNLAEAEEYVKALNMPWDRYQIMQSYMVLGGVPYYYSILDPKLSVAQNIDRLFFRKDGKLRLEFDELYHALFPMADIYIEVVKVLSQHPKGLTFREISKAVGQEGTFLTRVLKNLERCDFIEKWPHFKNKKQTEIYRMTDNYTLFYYKFIDGNDFKNENWWTENLSSHSVGAWQGNSFEIVCMRHYRQIKKALGIAGVATEISTWKSLPTQVYPNGGQVDLVIERADRIIHLCEMKFSTGKYNISKDYEDKLRNRLGLFKSKTRTTKAVVHTFVTTFGLGEGKHHSIVHSEVTMDDLFNS